MMDGQQLIIDYKTSKNNNINNWFDKRPTEVQLPLYAMSDPDHIAGITYAEVLPGACQFKGVSSDEINIKGIKAIKSNKQSNVDWHEQLASWQETLNYLATDFYSGNAKVDPKDGEKTCTVCMLKTLCRLRDEVNDDISNLRH